jgi:hypothetical protein
VLLAQAAGNGVKLVDLKKQTSGAYGMDVSKAMDILLKNYPDLRDKVILAGVKDAEGKTAQYSNFGSNIFMKELPEGSMEGTSFSAPQFWAELYNYWVDHPDLGAGDVFADVLGLPREGAADGGDTEPKEPEPISTPAPEKPAPVSPALPTKPTPAVTCPGGLQVCGNSCIPTNAECCDTNSYCVKPGGSCSDLSSSNCYSCSLGQKFCGMFCVDAAKKCTITTTKEPAPTPSPAQPTPPPTPKEEVPTGTISVASGSCVSAGQRQVDVWTTVYQYQFQVGGSASGYPGAKIDPYQMKDVAGYTIDCGSWSNQGGECVRAAGQPETTSWKINFPLEPPYAPGEYNVDLFIQIQTAEGVPLQTARARYACL